MPDVTMCSNDNCKLCWNCYRYNAEPSENYQAYKAFEPDIDENGKTTCDWFKKTTKKKK